jgi:hypothetical protein
VFTPSDNELLVRIDERTNSIHKELVGEGSKPGLISRVSDLESYANRSKGMVAVISGIVSLAVTAAVRWLMGWHR